jgi:hypothetical protein
MRSPFVCPREHLAGVARVMGYMQLKSAIYMARTYGGRLRNCLGEHFWARGYFGSTVGYDCSTPQKTEKQPSSCSRHLLTIVLFGFP